MNFKEQMTAKVAAIEEILKAYMPKEEGPQKLIMEAMNYSVTVGGKRLRPMLMQETYALFGGEGDAIEPFMAAQEMIHTYSLVHDDLPAMDNDEYRRGKKTTWVAYGEDMAILAGDGLLNYAFETALKAFGKADAMKVAECLKILAGKAGIYGMIGGQVVDVMSEEKKIDMETLLFIHRNKTSALIQSSMMIGAILAGASEEDVKKIEKIGEDIGLELPLTMYVARHSWATTARSEGVPISVISEGMGHDNEKTTQIYLASLESSVVDKANRKIIKLV